MPRCFSPAMNPPSSTATTWWSTAPSPAAATGPRSSRAMSPCARRSIRARGDFSNGNARAGGMDARLERKLRSLAAVVAAGVIAGILFAVAQGRTSATSLAVGASYGLLMSVSLGATELLVLEGPMREWLGSLSLATNLIVRSTIYVAIIIVIQLFHPGEVIAGVSPDTSSKTFWFSLIYSVVLSVVMNLALGITNIIGPRALLNFVIGRYHTPVEEKRFVLFVDIAGSTGLAERLGGIAIHRLLDRTFRLLTVAVEDYRGEVLNYVVVEGIVTWPERRGAIECPP